MTNYFSYLGDDRTKWYPSNGGWVFHVVSSASEWVCAAAFDIFMLTLVDEFKGITMDPPQVFIEKFLSFQSNLKA